MRVAIAGGGPGGLYLSLLLKKARSDAEVVVMERNPAGATYGWGVVFSDRTLSSFREADLVTYEHIVDSFVIWDAIDVRYRDEVVRCGGQGFSGIERKLLLGILQRRAEELGVRLEFEREVAGAPEVSDFDLVVAADGVRSVLRAEATDAFGPSFDIGRSRYIWFGTRRSFDSFTFIFRGNDDGFFQAHAYPYDGTTSTFIVECREDAWRRAGLDTADEDASIAYCEKLFERELRGRRLMSNNSRWINFVTIKNRRWHHDNVVLLGDAAHTAHFSIGSGTKLAMEDAISLADALRTTAHVPDALVTYELDRKPRVERFQQAARQSQTYFENTVRYQHMEPLQFAFHLLSRSGRIDYDDLRMRDRRFVASVDGWFARRPLLGPLEPPIATPPAFSPLRLRALELSNRIVVAATTGYAARDGVIAGPGMAASAGSGAGLVMSGIVAVSEQARITPACAGIYTPDQQAGWRRQVEDVHTAGAIAAITLSHSGPRGSTRDRSDGADLPLGDGDAWTTVAASRARYTPQNTFAAEIDRAQMDDVLTDFVEAARRARDAGFGMVELHMGHGYLLATFISPLTNRRTDAYGGSAERRLRYPLEVLDAVRAEWPEDLPVGVALSASDWARGGVTIDDAVVIARALRAHGCDGIRVFAGQTVGRYRPRYDQYFLTHYADRVRNGSGIATIATGDITTVDDVNTIVAAGRADLCLLRSG